MCLLIVFLLFTSLALQPANAAEPAPEIEVTCELVRGLTICEVPPLESLEYLEPMPDDRALNERTISL